jgi:hypothetical protein
MAALLLVLAIGARWVTPASVAAAAERGAPRTSFDVTAYRLPQVASRTATPRIRLPTATVTTGATAGSGPTAPSGATQTGTGTVGPGTAAAATATSGRDGARASSTPGAPLAPGSEATAAIAPPALPGDGGTSGGGTGAGADRGVIGNRTLDSAAVAGPSGVVRVPVTDPVVREMWHRFGSPLVGEAYATRLTAGRPGPWGWIGLYIALIAAFAGALWQVLTRVASTPPTAEDTPSPAPAGEGDGG